jgi:hypothetical protein
LPCSDSSKVLPETSRPVTANMPAAGRGPESGAGKPDTCTFDADTVIVTEAIGPRE